MKYKGKNIYYDKKGYAIIWINGKNTKVHLLEWENHNGKKPDGYQLHHKDFNKSNWHIDNLQLETQSDHKKVHAGWVRKNGEWILKPCKGCKKKLPLNKFYQRKGLTPSNRCINCSSIFSKEKLLNDPNYRESKRLYLKEYYKKNKVLILKKQKDARRKEVAC